MGNRARKPIRRRVLAGANVPHRERRTEGRGWAVRSQRNGVRHHPCLPQTAHRTRAGELGQDAAMGQGGVETPKILLDRVRRAKDLGRGYSRHPARQSAGVLQPPLWAGVHAADEPMPLSHALAGINQLLDEGPEMQEPSAIHRSAGRLSVPATFHNEGIAERGRRQ